eukprot:UN13133
MRQEKLRETKSYKTIGRPALIQKKLREAKLKHVVKQKPKGKASYTPPKILPVKTGGKKKVQTKIIAKPKKVGAPKKPITKKSVKKIAVKKSAKKSPKKKSSKKSP